MKENILTQLLIEQLQGGKIEKIIGKIVEADFRRELGDNSFRADIFITLSTERISVDEKFDSKKTRFVAIEVKIKDWKQGLYQAWKYNTFAEKSYLALYKKYSKNVDVAMFRRYNVGLIVFDESAVDVLNVPRNNKFPPKSYSNDLRKRLWARLAAVECA